MGLSNLIILLLYCNLIEIVVYRLLILFDFEKTLILWDCILHYSEFKNYSVIHRDNYFFLVCQERSFNFPHFYVGGKTRLLTNEFEIN